MELTFNTETASYVYMNKHEKKLIISRYCMLEGANIIYLMKSDGGGNYDLALDFCKIYCLGYIMAQDGYKVTNDPQEFK